MKFLIQTNHGNETYDFAFTLIQAKGYYDWRHSTDDGDKLELAYTDFTFNEISIPDDYIPIGSVDFVSNYLKRYYPESTDALKPLNVPEELFPFAGRRIANIRSEKELQAFQEKFPEREKASEWQLYLKSKDEIKSSVNGPVSYPFGICKALPCQMSEMIKIVSEWRVFVFQNKVLYVANYAGDCMKFPLKEKIRQIVSAYEKAAPVAYTLDVAVKDSGETIVIECHRFFSCGLYGFADLAKLPYMFSQTWNEMIRTKNHNSHV